MCYIMALPRCMFAPLKSFKGKPLVVACNCHLIYFVLLRSATANPGNSFAEKIAFTCQRKQLICFDSSFTCGDEIYEV